MEFTHFNEQNRARMVNVGDKNVSKRLALASGRIFVSPELIELINGGRVKKGDVLAVSQVAGIMAAKETSRIIPMCHPLFLSGVDIQFSVNDDSIDAVSVVTCEGKTGVEMEALTAVSIALLSIYDMCKSTGYGMSMGNISLLYKEGGKSDYVRDKGAAGEVVSLNVGSGKGSVKKPVSECSFISGKGIENDAHFGSGKRQVSLLARESYAEVDAKPGHSLEWGSFGENITTGGLSFHTLPLGTIFKIGNVFLRLSQTGKTCRSGEEKQPFAGDCVMPGEVVFAEVIYGGKAVTGDPIQIIG